jgi:hypothetical protein
MATRKIPNRTAIGNILGSAPAEPPPSAPTLTSPTPGSYTVGQSVTLTATSPDGDLTRIDFVLDPGGGESVIATDAISPYSQGWLVAGSVGAHTLVARAVRGALSTDSAPVSVTFDASSDELAPAAALLLVA